VQCLILPFNICCDECHFMNLTSRNSDDGYLHLPYPPYNTCLERAFHPRVTANSSRIGVFYKYFPSPSASYLMPHIKQVFVPIWKIIHLFFVENYSVFIIDTLAGHKPPDTHTATAPFYHASGKWRLAQIKHTQGPLSPGALYINWRGSKC
jgi:hypothetical protein